eukprot:scaffold14825_cov123-Isochrysis_galbana.AAC.4
MRRDPSAALPATADALLTFFLARSTARFAFSRPREPSLPPSPAGGSAPDAAERRVPGRQPSLRALLQPAPPARAPQCNGGSCASPRQAR